ncbi:MAG: sigma-70 family RNA polymerase sigma factor [Chloroflexi bacterium]|nr:sigma-70 family RNA polymerase sigma factor [Chloroflexota bacterium]
MDTAILDYPKSVIQVIDNERTEDFTDESLMRAICYSQAEWALEKLYERYKRYVYSLAYRILGDSLLAEDVVQDVFFALWRKALSYHEQQGSVKSWLQAIVRNRAIDKVRSSAHRDYQCAHLEDVKGEDLSSAEPEMWEQVWEYEQSKFIRKALAQLPTEQRSVIELSYFYGYTHVEIARQQQLPLGTVKGRMRLGLQKIKLLLQEYGADIHP